jgi:hypothetical protein
MVQCCHLAIITTNLLFVYDLMIILLFDVLSDLLSYLARLLNLRHEELLRDLLIYLALLLNLRHEGLLTWRCYF